MSVRPLAVWEYGGANERTFCIRIWQSGNFLRVISGALCKNLHQTGRGRRPRRPVCLPHEPRRRSSCCVSKSGGARTLCALPSVRTSDHSASESDSPGTLCVSYPARYVKTYIKPVGVGAHDDPFACRTNRGADNRTLCIQIRRCGNFVRVTFDAKKGAACLRKRLLNAIVSAAS